MINTFKLKLTNILDLKNQRSQKILKNIVMSVGVKGGSILVGLVLVPLTIDYINPVQYGIWLTISSIISWMSFFDIGMGNGLRNKLTTALARNEYDDARKYVSTTYATLVLISLCLFILFWFVNPYIDWRKFLNIPSSVGDNIHLVLLIVFCSFCVQFVVQLLNTVLTSIHEPATAGLISFLGQVGLLIVIYVLKLSVPGSLQVLVSALTVVPIIVLIIASAILYNTKLKAFAPSFKSVDFSYAKSILNIGGAFFVIQIGALVLFQTNNIIITKVIGPEAVTEFNVAYKLFSVVTMAFTIIITPYWSAFTDAYTKQDFAWMKNNLATIRKLWILLSLVIIVVLACSDWLFSIWLGKRVVVDHSLSLAIAAYVIVYMWQTLHVYLLNGIGIIRLQLILVTISATINIPLAIWLGEKWGSAGIISANTLIFALMGLIFSFQCDKILTQKATGIWRK